MSRPWALGPYENGRGWLRGLGVALVAGLFLAFAGAFGTDEVTLGRRLVYWLALMAAGTVFGAFIVRAFYPAGRPRAFWPRGLIAAAAMAAPFSLVVWGATGFMLGQAIPATGLPVLFSCVFAVSLIMVTLNLLIERSRERAVEPEPAGPPRFLDRLPLKLRGAEVWAVEAEDHYLRLHTSKGQDLILMRLADAIEELAGIEGMQVHRSWWVARDGIADARRGDGRATLTLKDGATCPVSRTYAGELRGRAWI